ncbi:MAG: hypothetical protein NDJ92_15670, partial [Thermoanaerobaculia bacterium]|nr:hypothetical protein [Thermoanaerobaculia bacterium]
MRRLFPVLAAAIAVLTMSCATAPAPSRPPATAVPTAPPPPASAYAQHPNALRPVSAAAATLVEPLVRVGLASDQATAAFARIDGGYEIRTQASTFSILRGFTVHAPVASSRVVFAIQVGAISDRASAERLAERVRNETG